MILSASFVIVFDSNFPPQKMGDSPYSLYKDVMMPTTTDICTFAHFTSLEHHNLIIAKAHVLYVYTFEPTLRQQVQGGQQPQEQQKSDMRLAYTFPLHGTIVDVVSVKRSASAASGSALDYLLLSFNDAKVRREGGLRGQCWPYFY